ncbi:hypothetical protein LTR36_008678 [Oleoguttula mirabilis]|uniref:ATPase inhibitor, mitochondrial n=1 Tax=Oleoguttula mirabilis TaxID=1507867 RepID=A0AAV9JTR1_9PEZI|nr:hypothetical protein LTR36_008678 [Oleoguttula mirabilis]
MSSLRTLTRALPRQLPTTSTRTFSAVTRHMAAGDTGGTRSGGAAQGDAFSKRERANEDYEIRRREMDKLEALKRKIADNEAQLAKDRQEVEGLSKEEGGKQ